MARIIGIDLGTHAVKIAVFQGGFGRFQLQEFRSAPVPQGGDAVPDLDARIDVLRELLRQLPSEPRTLSAAGFPAEQASIRLVSLPFGDRDQVERTLPFEVENLVPFDLDEMVLASRILSVEEDGSRVLTALARRTHIRPLLAGLTDAGADPRVLALDADLLGDVAGDGVQAVVDIGHARTLLSLCRDGHTVGARAISSGGRDLTLALADAHDLSFATAETRKHAADIYAEENTDTLSEVTVQVADDLVLETTDAVSPDDGHILRVALAPLLSEVRASLIAFEDAHGVEVEEVVLAGGTANLGGLREWLQAILGVPVRLASLPDESHGAGPGGDHLHVLSHALALKAGGGKGRTLDFRQQEFGFRGDLAYMGTVLKAAAAVAGLLLVAGVAWFGWRFTTLSSDLAALDNEIAETVVTTFPEVSRSSLDSPSKSLAIMTEKTVAATSRVEALGAILSEEPPTLSLLKEVSENVPPASEATIDVSELSISPTNVVLKAETDGYEAAATIEAALKQSPRLRQARKGDEQKKRDKVRFTITIPLEDEGEPTDEG